MTEPDIVAWDQTLTPLSDPENVMFVLVDPDSEEERDRPPPSTWVLPDTPTKVMDETAVVAAADVMTGAMIAFVPSVEDADRLALEGYEPPTELHVTSVYLGDAVDIGDDVRADIVAVLTELADSLEPIVANVFGVSILNPTGDEPYLVLNVGGADLWGAQEIISGLADDYHWASDEQHSPWLAHITLGYMDDPREVMTDAVLGRVGPIMLDRVRVAFAGVVTDIPLGDGLAAAAVNTAFHMPGKHNQATHGRGGASSGELSAGERLNAGKSLDMSDPEHAAIASGIHSWATTHAGGGVMSRDDEQFKGEIADAIHNPGAQTRGAQFTRTVAGAPATAPVLHRGMADVPDHKIPQAGDVFDLGPTSFTSDRRVAEGFARPKFNDLGSGTMVTMRVAKGSHALNVERAVPKAYRGEKEHVALGRYHVTSRKESTVTVTAQDGKKRSVTHIELELTQVDDSMPITHITSAPRVIDANELYGN
jgi:hypothetical protein